VPKVDCGVGERLAGARVKDGEVDVERDSGLVFGDVGANELVGDVEGADLLLGCESAGWRLGEGLGREVKRSGGCEGTGEKTTSRE
jgi:hypothetical protein